ncbi:hypothetical protein D3C77_200300 [compost metagenome]
MVYRCRARLVERRLHENFGTETWRKGAAGWRRRIGLENRRWATILEFESLRFLYLQAHYFSGFFAFMKGGKQGLGNIASNLL